MTVNRVPLMGIAMLLLASPELRAQDRHSVPVRVDLKPRPIDGAGHLFLVGTREEPVPTPEPRLEGGEWTDLIRVGLWIQHWPVEQELELQPGIYYRAVYGFQNHPQPLDPISDAVQFQDAGTPLDFVISWEPFVPLPSTPPTPATDTRVALQVHVEELSLEGSQLALLVFEVDSSNAEWDRLDTSPLLFIDLPDAVPQDGIIQLHVDLPRPRIYIPMLSYTGKQAPVRGEPTLYEGGPQLNLRFTPLATSTPIASSPPKEASPDAAISSPPSPSESPSRTPLWIAIAGTILLLGWAGFIRSRRVK